MVYEIMGHWFLGSSIYHTWTWQSARRIIWPGRFNAASNALAFTRAPNSKASAKDVDDFHQLVVCLGSTM